MAKVVLLMGKGGQRRAERELGWDRKTIINGTQELKTVSGVSIIFLVEGDTELKKNCQIYLKTSDKL